VVVLPVDGNGVQGPLREHGYSYGWPVNLNVLSNCVIVRIHLLRLGMLR
jgi:hypothetical protein